MISLEGLNDFHGFKKPDGFSLNLRSSWLSGKQKSIETKSKLHTQKKLGSLGPDFLTLKNLPNHVVGRREVSEAENTLSSLGGVCLLTTMHVNTKNGPRAQILKTTKA